MARKKKTEVAEEAKQEEQVTLTHDEIFEASKPLINLLNSKGADNLVTVCVSKETITVKRDLAVLTIQYGEEKPKE